MEVLDADLKQRLADLLGGDPRVLGDPFSTYSDLQAVAPVVESGSMALVLSYREAREVIQRDNTSFSVRAKVDQGSRHMAQRAQWESGLTPEQLQLIEEFFVFQGLVMSRNDGETHARLRGVATRSLTPRAVAESHATIQTTVDELLEPMTEQEQPDLREFALQLPLRVMMTMLTMPWNEELLVQSARTINQVAEEPDELLRSHSVMQEYRGYGEELVARYRHRAEDVPALAASIFDARLEGRLSADEHTAMIFNLVFAGHETTMNLITIGMFELLRNRDQWRLLCDDPSRVEQAVDELLRYVAPVQMLSRVAIEDVEIGGHRIAEGTTVAAVVAAANRDPAVFDSPDRLDVLRTDSGKQLSLGFGRHYCVGASLARLEAVGALENLARRYPDIELAVDDVEWAGSCIVRTIPRLPVVLGRPRRDSRVADRQ